MANKPFSINLLQTGKGKNVDRFINWALTIGRVLVIVTELVALGAFLYRFGLDQQVIDTTTKIKQEQAIVANLKNQENTYRNLQDRLSLAASTMAISAKREKIYQDIVGLAPNGMTFNTVALSANSVRVDANVNSVIPLSVFVNSLKSYPAITGVSIDRIENKTSDATISVSITANLKQEDSINATSN